MSELRVFYNVCGGEYFRFGSGGRSAVPSDGTDFVPCSHCSRWGWLDEAPDYIIEWDRREYPDLQVSDV